jgi:hypothetical protein
MKRVIFASLAGLAVLAAALIAAGMLRGIGDSDTAGADNGPFPCEGSYCPTGYYCSEEGWCFPIWQCSEDDNCADDNLCTVDDCNEIEGNCNWTCLPDETECGGDGVPGQCINCVCQYPSECETDEDCDDGQWCTIDECIEGECLNTEKDCDDQNPCTTDSCNEEMERCDNDPVANGTECPGGTCQDGQCVGQPQLPPSIPYSLSVDVTLDCGEAGSDAVTLEGTIMISTGALQDGDLNGKEEVPVEITSMALSGSSSKFGELIVTRRDPSQCPYQDSEGKIEENANNTEGVLDIPPLTGTGSGYGDFDFYLDIQGSGIAPVHNHDPLQMVGPIYNLLAERHYTAVSGSIQLYDNVTEEESECTITGTKADVAPVPLESSYYLTVDASLQCGEDSETLALGGTIVTLDDLTSVGDEDFNGFDEIPTEITAMSLTGYSSLLGGAVEVTLPESSYGWYHPSLGEVEENTNTTDGLDVPPFALTGTADAFFDVYFKIVSSSVAAHNNSPLHVEALLDNLLGAADYSAVGGSIVLYDNGTNEPIGCAVTGMAVTADPVPEVTQYDLALFASLQCDSQSEALELNGTIVTWDHLESVGDTDEPPDGLDQIPTEIIGLNLTGRSSLLGDVTVTLPNLGHPCYHPSLGEVEEMVNTTDGLDVPPFTETGTANAFFDVYFQLQGNPIAVHNHVPLHVEALLNNLLGGALYMSQTGLAVQLFDNVTDEPIGCQVGNITARAIPSFMGPAVGGIVELRAGDNAPAAAAASSSDSGFTTPLAAALAAAGVVIVAAGTWYARRRWVR